MFLQVIRPASKGRVLSISLTQEEYKNLLAGDQKTEEKLLSTVRGQLERYEDPNYRGER